MNKKIVLIEDNEDVRENIEELLELSGYNVKSAGNGKDGAALIVEEIPDLVICDIMMPKLDGFGVLKVVSSNDRTKNIPFIFLSAKAEKEDFRKGMNLGADDYITKPFEDLQLLEAVETRIKKNEARGGNFSLAGIEEFYSEENALKAIQELCDDESEMEFDKKERIFKETAAPKHVYLIESGMVKSVQVNEDGKELVSGLYGQGDFIGLADIFMNKAYCESAKALSVSKVFRILREDLLHLIHANSDVAMFIYRKMAFSIEIRKRRLLHMAYDSVRMRTADSLLWLNDVYNTANSLPFSIAFSREDLAAMVGTAKESLIRNLSSFKEEGLVETDFSNITILDTEGLKKIVGS